MTFYGYCAAGQHKTFFLWRRKYTLPKPVGEIVSENEQCWPCYRRIKKGLVAGMMREVTPEDRATRPPPGPNQITVAEAMALPRAKRRSLRKVNNGLKIPGSTRPIVKTPKTNQMVHAQKVDIRNRPKPTPQKP